MQLCRLEAGRLRVVEPLDPEPVKPQSRPPRTAPRVHPELGSAAPSSGLSNSTDIRPESRRATGWRPARLAADDRRWPRSRVTSEGDRRRRETAAAAPAASMSHVARNRPAGKHQIGPERRDVPCRPKNPFRDRAATAPASAIGSGAARPVWQARIVLGLARRAPAAARRETDAATACRCRILRRHRHASAETAYLRRRAGRSRHRTGRTATAQEIGRGPRPARRSQSAPSSGKNR